MMRAERENPGGDAVLERRAGGRDVACGERGRRRDAVIHRRDEHGVQHAADGGRRQLAHQQEVDRLREAETSHHLVERIAAHQNLVRLDVGERRLPAVALFARRCATFGDSTFSHNSQPAGSTRAPPRGRRARSAPSAAARLCRTNGRRNRRGRARCICDRSAFRRRRACRSRRRDAAARQGPRLPGRPQCKSYE